MMSKPQQRELFGRARPIFPIAQQSEELITGLLSHELPEPIALIAEQGRYLREHRLASRASNARAQLIMETTDQRRLILAMQGWQLRQHPDRGRGRGLDLELLQEPCLETLEVRRLLSFNPAINYPIGLKDTITSGDLPVVWTNARYHMLYMNMGHGDKIFTNKEQNQIFENAVLWLGASASGEKTKGKC